MREAALKGEREGCYQARDEFYRCFDSSEAQQYTPDGKPIVKSQCKQERQLYESLCRSSWVKHFDKNKAQEKQAKAVLSLQQEIRESVATARGTLAGKPQQEDKIPKG